METINKKYKVTAQVLTPLSIGQGSEKDWVYGVDYLVRTGPDYEKRLLLYHLDLGKMYAAGIDVNRLSSCWANGDVGGVERLIGNKLESVCDFVLPLPTGIGKQGLRNPIKTFLRNDFTNRPVLAGSSLKGALRSVLFSNLRTADQKDNKSVFGDMKDGNDFMRFVRVGDFEFEETRLVNTKIYNLHKDGNKWQGGWKHDRNYTSSQFEQSGFNTIYECLPPRSMSEGYVMFADKLFAKVAAQGDTKKKKEILNDVEILCDKINDHTYNYLNKEIEFFNKYNKYDKAEKCSEITNSISKIQDVIDSCASNECVLKMSAGSGFHSITGDWQYEYYYEYTDENTGKKFLLDRKKREGQFRANDLPKSRKIAVSGSRPFSLMGFVKLTFTKE